MEGRRERLHREGPSTLKGRKNKVSAKLLMSMSREVEGKMQIHLFCAQNLHRVHPHNTLKAVLSSTFLYILAIFAGLLVYTTEAC
jgi:hypothetical protein